jgi:hypothetical protein
MNAREWWTRALDAGYAHFGPASLDALRFELELCPGHDAYRARIVAEVEGEIRADGARAPNGKRAETLAWLEHVLASGCVRVLELRHRAKDAEIGWRLVEALKVEAGAVTTQRRDGWWWGARPHRPQAKAEPSATVNA